MEWLLINIIESFLLTWFTIYFLNAKNNYIWIFRFLIFFINFILVSFSNYINLYDIFLTSILIIINCFISYWFTYNSLPEIFFIWTLLEVYTCLIGNITIIIYTFYKSLNLSLTKQTLYFIFMLLIMKYFDRKSIKLSKKLYLILAILFFILQYIMQQLIQIYVVLYIKIPEMIYIFILMTLFIVIMITVILIISNYIRIENKYNSLKKEQQNQNAIKYLYEQLKILKHNLKHDYQLIDHYITTHDYNKITKLIHHHYNEIISTPSLIDTPNLLLNTIINNKIIQASFHNINVICTINVIDNIPMKDYHLNDLLSNLLDNSIENCPNNGTININIVYDNQVLYISIRNSTFDTFDKSLKSKKNGEFHGYGLKSIKHIINLYDGNLDMIHNNNVFATNISLYLK